MLCARNPRFVVGVVPEKMLRASQPLLPGVNVGFVAI